MHLQCLSLVLFFFQQSNGSGEAGIVSPGDHDCVISHIAWCAENRQIIAANSGLDCALWLVEQERRDINPADFAVSLEIAWVLSVSDGKFRDSVKLLNEWSLVAPRSRNFTNEFERAEWFHELEKIKIECLEFTSRQESICLPEIRKWLAETNQQVSQLSDNPETQEGLLTKWSKICHTIPEKVLHWHPEGIGYLKNLQMAAYKCKSLLEWEFATKHLTTAESKLASQRRAVLDAEKHGMYQISLALAKEMTNRAEEVYGPNHWLTKENFAFRRDCRQAISNEPIARKEMVLAREQMALANSYNPPRSVPVDPKALRLAARQSARQWLGDESVAARQWALLIAENDPEIREALLGLARTLSVDHEDVQPKLRAFINKIEKGNRFSGPPPWLSGLHLDEVGEFVNTIYPADHWCRKDYKNKKDAFLRIKANGKVEIAPLNEIFSEHFFVPTDDPNFPLIGKIQSLQKAVESSRALLGSESMFFFVAKSRLASLLDAKGDHDRSYSLHLEALEGLRRSAGDFHPLRLEALESYTRCLAGLSDKLEEEKNRLDWRLLDQASGYWFRGAAAPAFKYAGDLGPAGANFLKIADTFAADGDYAKAEPIYRELLAGLGKSRDKNPVLLSAVKNNLGALYASFGDFDMAEPLFQQNLDYAASNQPGSDKHAMAMHNLGVYLDKKGDPVRAEKILRQDVALTIDNKIIGKLSQAQSMETLAWVLGKNDKLDEAIDMMRRAEPVFLLNAPKADLARFLTNYGVLWRLKNNYQKAEECSEKSLSIYGETYPSGHPDYADALAEAARLAFLQGRVAKATGFAEKALDQITGLMNRANLVQSFRQQQRASAAFRGYLDLWITVTTKAGLETEKAYAKIFAWKGAVFSKARTARNNPRDIQDFESRRRVLTDKINRVSYLALGPANEEKEAIGKWNSMVLEAVVEKENAEKALYLTLDDSPITKLATPSLNRLFKALAPSECLVDFYEYVPAGLKSPRIKAYVVAGSKVWDLDLCDSATLAEHLKSWRNGRWGETENSRMAAGKLRGLIWEPLEEQISGYDRILVSPDGLLCEVPFSCLPAKHQERFLIEEKIISLCPAPQFLRERKPGGKTMSMVTIGGVDFGESTETKAFKPLPGTVKEILALRGIFENTNIGGDFRIIRGNRPRSYNVERMAAGSQIVHFATHGYYLGSQKIKQAGHTNERLRILYDFQPDLFTGLALANANRALVDPREEGLLRALDISQWKLDSCDLVVLSACQSAQGRNLKCEGMMSLQRAFLVAGANSVVGSLWSVDDLATEMLMEKFYSNLWNLKMDKPAALQAAKIWMLRQGWSDSALVKGLNLRGLEPLNQFGGRNLNYLPPFYWAAFEVAE